MAAGGVGFFVTGFWHLDYWHTDYWVEESSAAVVLTPLDVKLPPKVLALLTRLGKDVVFEVPASHTHTKKTGAVVENSVADVSVKAILDKYRKMLGKGSTTRRDKVRMYLPARGLTFTPERSQQVRFDGHTYRVEKVTPVQSGELVAMWQLELRGAGAFTESATFTTLDTRLVPKVEVILARHGLNVTLQQYATAHNPKTGDMVKTAPVSFTAKATPPMPYSEKYIDGDSVQRGDAAVFIAGKELSDAGYVPKRGDTLTFVTDAIVWRVLNLGLIYSGSQVALWELQLRR